MLLPGKNFKDKNFTYFQTSFLQNLGQPCTNWYIMKCTHGIYLHFCFNELVQGCPRFCRKCKKPCFPSQSVNLDVPIIFEKKMSQCKIKKYLENFSLTDPPWPTVQSVSKEGRTKGGKWELESLQRRHTAYWAPRARSLVF